MTLLHCMSPEVATCLAPEYAGALDQATTQTQRATSPWRVYQDILVARPLHEHYDLHGQLFERVHAYIKRGARLAVTYPDMERRAFYFGPVLRVFSQTESDLEPFAASLHTDPISGVAAEGILVRKARSVPSADQFVQLYRFRRKPGMEHIKNHSLPIRSQSSERLFRFEFGWREREGDENNNPWVSPDTWTPTGGASYGVGYWLPAF